MNSALVAHDGRRLLPLAALGKVEVGKVSDRQIVPQLGFLSRGVMTELRFRKNFGGLGSSLLDREFPVAAYGDLSDGSVPAAGSLDRDEGLRAGGAHANTKAPEQRVPLNEFSRSWQEPVGLCFGNPVAAHATLRELWGSTGVAHLPVTQVIKRNPITEKLYYYQVDMVF